MDLVVNEFSAFLGKESRRLTVKTKTGKTEVPIDDVDTVFVAAGASMSTAALRLAAESFVDVVILDSRGNPVARVFPCNLGGTTLTRKRQAQASIGRTGVQIAHALVVSKILNQGYFLKSLAKTREGSESLGSAADRILERGRTVEVDADRVEEARQQLLGYEGASAAEYFAALSSILPMGERQRHARDPVNALLNYGYGFLYAESERACITAGLDPYLGFFHADRYGKACLILDLVEPFRPVLVDRVVVTQWVQKSVTANDFEEIEEGQGLRLKEYGRKRFCTAILERFNSEFTFDGKKMRFKDAILWQARQIVRAVNGEADWGTFIYKW